VIGRKPEPSECATLVANIKRSKSLEMKENRVSNNDRKGKTNAGMLVAIAALFILAFAFFVGGSGSGTHVGSNPGPSGIPESNIINPAPPPATDPSSGTTTGTAR
jgi:hypothetical protein